MQQRKMTFRLAPDADGWPPASAESVWVTARPDGLFVVENIPFFAAAATLDDIVKAEVEDGELRYQATVTSSGNSLLRVICAKEVDPAQVRASLTSLGCTTELNAGHRLIAVNVPASVRLGAVLSFLEEGAADERWDYEEALLAQ